MTDYCIDLMKLGIHSRVPRNQEPSNPKSTAGLTSETSQLNSDWNSMTFQVPVFRSSGDLLMWQNMELGPVWARSRHVVEKIEKNN